MDLIGMLNDVEQHLKHGAGLADSHLPSLLHVAGVISGDPFVQAAINTTLSDAGKGLVTDLVSRLEALEQARAAAVPAADPDAAPPA